MFINDMVEAATNEVSMETFTSTTVEIILKYIYTGMSSSVLTLLEECDMPSMNELMNAAGMYELEAIKIACYKYIIKKFVTVDNVYETILNGFRHGFDIELLEPAMSFLRRNSAKVVKSDEFIKFLKDNKVYTEFFLN